MDDFDLHWSKLASITTDGAPSVAGTTRGLVGHLSLEFKEQGPTRPLQVHCLIHQQALCSKLLRWASVMKVGVHCVNYIQKNALKHRQFQAFLSELESAYGDVLYYTDIDWLSWGRVLHHFYDLLPEINTFLQSQGEMVQELTDPERKWHLAFLTDVTEMLNHLNVQLQGKGKLISDVFPHQSIQGQTSATCATGPKAGLHASPCHPKLLRWETSFRVPSWKVQGRAGNAAGRVQSAFLRASCQR